MKLEYLEIGAPSRVACETHLCAKFSLARANTLVALCNLDSTLKYLQSGAFESMNILFRGFHMFFGCHMIFRFGFTSIQSSVKRRIFDFFGLSQLPFLAHFYSSFFKELC